MVRRRLLRHLLLLFLSVASGIGSAQAGEPDDRQRRCLTMIAYAEAAGEGSGGMLAVMKVVHNRVVHPDFADDICAVALERGQFQPVSERPALRHGARIADRAEPRRGGRCRDTCSAPHLGRGVAACRGRCDLARARSDRRRALLRQSSPDGSGQVPVVRRSEADGGDRRARVHGQLCTRRAPARPALDCATAGRGYGAATKLAGAQATGRSTRAGQGSPAGPRPRPRCAPGSVPANWHAAKPS